MENAKNIGRLTMAATHLGEPRDLPPRSLEALRDADLLVFEEDRPARSFLKAAGVHRDYVKWTEHREKGVLEDVTAALKAGKWVCYMSDQGTPGLADPGRDLVEIAYRLGARVQVIPGPSSVTAAIAACPFDCKSFLMLGFLPKEPGDRARALRQAAEGRRPFVVMDTPYRLKHVLETCEQVLPGKKGMLALDISGEHEDYWVGPFAQLRKRAEALDGKLNFVLIVE